MANPRDIIAARHPIWNANQAKWTYFYDAFMGGADYPSKANPLARVVIPTMRPHEGQQFYVTRHPLEDSSDYWLRVNRAAVVNLCASPISLLVGTIGQQDSVVIDLPREYGVILDDADAMGSSLLQFMATARRNAAVYGHTFLIVDSTKAQGPIYTQADVLGQGIRPYVREIVPADMLAWRLDDFGQPIEVLFRIQRDCTDSILTAPSNQDQETQYRLWTRQEWITFREEDGTAVEVDRGINPIGIVPVVCLYHSRIQPWLGDSLIKEASKYGQLATNWLSDLDAVASMQSFSQPWLRSKDAPEKVGFGVSKILHLQPAHKDPRSGEDFGAEEIGYSSPDASPMQAQWDGFMRLVDLANASMDLKPEASTDKAHPESGISRAWRWHAAERRLVQMAMAEQEAVKSVLYLCALWMGQPNFTGSVSYGTRYDLSAVQDDITQMLALQAAGLPPTAQRELMRACLQKTLPNLDQATQTQINKELERIGAIPMPIQQA